MVYLRLRLNMIITQIETQQCRVHVTGTGFGPVQILLLILVPIIKPTRNPWVYPYL